MASKRRRRRRGCLAKKSYGTLREASEATVRCYWATREALSANHCRNCGAFHIGHPPTAKRTRLDFKSL